MKLKIKVLIVLFTLLFLFSSNLTMVKAQSESYVGITEDDSFIWEVDYDEEGFEKLESDLGTTDIFSEVDDDIEAIKIDISNIKAEEDHSLGEGVKLDYYLMETKDKDKNDWEQTFVQGYIIYQYEDDGDIISFYQNASYEGNFFVATNVDWDEVMEDYDDSLSSIGEAEVKSKELGKVKLKILIYAIGSVKEIEISTNYNENGVLESYEFSYDGEDILTAELTNTDQIDPIILWIIIIIIIGVVIGAAIVVVFIIKKITEEKPLPKPPEVIEQEKVEKEALKEEGKKLEPKINFCPNCGAEVTEEKIYCEFCGSKLRDL